MSRPTHMKRRASGSMPVDGSSSNTTAGSPISAMATESLRLLPPEYVPAWRKGPGYTMIEASDAGRQDEVEKEEYEEECEEEYQEK